MRDSGVSPLHVAESVVRRPDHVERGVEAGLLQGRMEQFALVEGNGPVQLPVHVEHRRIVRRDVSNRVRALRLLGMFLDRPADEPGLRRVRGVMVDPPGNVVHPQEVGRPEPVADSIRARGHARILLVDPVPFLDLVRRPEQGHKMPARRRAPSAHARRAESVGRGVGANPAHRGLDIRDGGRKQRLTAEPVLDGHQGEALLENGRRPADPRLRAASPPAAVHPHDDRHGRLRLRGREVDIQSKGPVANRGIGDVGQLRDAWRERTLPVSVPFPAPILREDARDGQHEGENKNGNSSRGMHQGRPPRVYARRRRTPRRRLATGPARRRRMLEANGTRPPDRWRAFRTRGARRWNSAAGLGRALRPRRPGTGICGCARPPARTHRAPRPPAKTVSPRRTWSAVRTAPALHRVGCVGSPGAFGATNRTVRSAPPPCALRMRRPPEPRDGAGPRSPLRW